MITAQIIRKRLIEQPFRPFRICLSDGEEYEVPHSEFAWVLGHRVFVGYLAKDDKPEEPSMRELSDLHVTRLEDVPRRRRPRRAR